MNACNIVAFSYMTYLYLKGRRKRKFLVHPINGERYRYGHYFTLYKQLREDPEKWFNYFRMSMNSFDELLSCVKGHIKHQDTNMRTAISLEEMLVITLR